MTTEKPKYKRLNRTTDIGAVLSRALDPVFQKRGFASKDLVAHWAQIAPSPYDTTTLPDQLKWPRGEKGAEGAILFLRCAPGQALAVSHEGTHIAAAINRYFGYVLVGQVKLSAAPFEQEKPVTAPRKEPAETVVRAVEAATADIEDDGIREALQHFGEGLLSRKQK